MKPSTLIVLFAMSVIVFCSCNKAKAQTTNTAPTLQGGLQELATAVTASPTNFAPIVGYERGLKGDKSIAFGGVAYQIVSSTALYVGYENARVDGKSTANMVKGGVNFSADLYPLKGWESAWAGFGKLKVSPFAFAGMATGSGSAEALLATGAKVDVWHYKAFTLDLAGIYENRSGNSDFEGNYIGGFLAGHLSF